MVDFVESENMIKISRNWINQTHTTGLVVIFHSLFKEELIQNKKNECFYILAIGKWILKSGENVKSYKGRERV